jgi:uncharacterized alkaline shock family protein YloU
MEGVNMKSLNGFLVVLSVIFLIVIGGGLLAHNFGVIDIEELVFEYGAEMWTALTGAVMLLFGVIAVVLNISAKRPEKSFSVENQEGEVRITFSAIEDMLKKSTSHIDGIEDIRPMVIEGKRGLEILSRVSVKEDTSIPQITLRIQEVIKSQVRDVLGIEEMGAIRTHIYRIAPRKEGKSGGKKEEKLSL